MQNKNHRNRSKNRTQQQTGNPHPVPPTPVAPISEPHANRNEDRHAGKNNQNVKMSSLDWSNKLSLLFDGLLVVTAFIGWYYIDKQLKMTELSNQVATHAMEESRNANDLTRQALEITNRAWITVRDVKLIGTIDRDPLVISYEFENTGHIPAERIEIKVTRTFQKQLGITTADQNPTIGSLAPGQKFTYFHKLPKLSPVAIEAMTNGEIQMSLSGTVAYSDHFAAREHHFCFYWDRDISHFGSCSERDTQQTQRAE